MVAGSVLAQETPPGEGESAGVPESGGVAGAAVWIVLVSVVVWALWKRGWFAKASYEGRRDFAGLSALGWVVVSAVVFFGQGAAGMVALSMTSGWDDLLRASFASCAGAAGGVAVWVVVRVRVLTGKQSGGMRMALRDVWVGALVFLAAVPFVVLAGVVAHSIGGPVRQLSHSTLRLLEQNDSVVTFGVTAFAVVVAAPVFEELLFRGLLQTTFRRAGLGVLGATVAASFAFLLVHASVLDGVMMPALFTLSMILGLSFEKTGRLGTPIVAHACFNAFNLWASGV